MPPALATPASVQIEHSPGRFRSVVEGLQCELEYRQAAGVMCITHTAVPAPLEGRGIAAQLMRAALEHAAASGWTVRPLCSYAAAYMRRHPESTALLAR